MKRLTVLAVAGMFAIVPLGTPEPTPAVATIPPHVAAIHLAAPVGPDTVQGCVSHAEYDADQIGLTRLQVANQFDTYGVYDGDNDAGTRYRAAYTPCWTDTQQVIEVFSYETGLDVNEWIRDV